jgi:hypothetical protein
MNKIEFVGLPNHQDTPYQSPQPLISVVNKRLPSPGPVALNEPIIHELGAR